MKNKNLFRKTLETIVVGAFLWSPLVGCSGISKKYNINEVSNVKRDVKLEQHNSYQNSYLPGIKGEDSESFQNLFNQYLGLIFDTNVARQYGFSNDTFSDFGFDQEEKLKLVRKKFNTYNSTVQKNILDMSTNNNLIKEISEVKRGVFKREFVKGIIDSIFLSYILNGSSGSKDYPSKKTGAHGKLFEDTIGSPIQ